MASNLFRMPDLMFSQLWLWRLPYSGMWYRVVWWIVPDVSGEHTSCIYPVYPEDGGSGLLGNISNDLPDYMASHPIRNNLYFSECFEQLLISRVHPHKPFQISFSLWISLFCVIKNVFQLFHEVTPSAVFVVNFTFGLPINCLYWVISTQKSRTFRRIFVPH
jgi:hypothetical protein